MAGQNNVGANPASVAQGNTPQTHKSEWTYTTWKNKVFNAVSSKTCGCFGRVVAEVAAALAFIPSLAVDGYYGKGLFARKVTSAPIKKQMPASGSQALASEIESLKAQLSEKSKSERNKSNRITDLKSEIASLKQNLSTRESQFNGHCASLQWKLEEKESLIQQKLEEIKKEQRAQKAKDDELETARIEIFQQRNLYEQLQEDFEESNLQYGKVFAELTEKNGLLKNYIESKRDLEKQVTGLETENKKLTSQNLELITDNARLRSEAKATSAMEHEQPQSSPQEKPEESSA